MVGFLLSVAGLGMRANPKLLDRMRGDLQADIILR